MLDANGGPSAGPPSAAVLVCDALDKRYGATHAVRDVSLTLAAGRTLALMGENGAGKSTLMAMIAGEVKPGSGSATVDGFVAVVHQELSLFADLTVGENICIGREPRLLGRGPVNNRALRTQARAALDRLGVAIDVDTPVSKLSPAEQQLVEIARAVALDPALLILDEPTSSLEPSQVDLLHAATERLKAAGTSVIFVSHRLEEVFRFADEIAVMRSGALVGAGPASDFTRESLVASMVGRELEQLYPDRSAARPDAAPILTFDAVGGHGVHDVSLTVKPGQIVGIAGLEGHGQHVVAELAAGVRRVRSGSIAIDETRAKLRSPREAIAAGIAFVPPDRRSSGLMLPLSIAENLTVAAAHRLHPSRLLSRAVEQRAIAPVAERLRLRYASMEQRVGELSGGNQQKVLFGRWLLVPNLRLLVLDDPTRGVDVGARAEIYSVLRELADRGVGVLLVSTDMLELIGLADEIHVMYEGAVRGTVPGHSATEEEIMTLASGVTA
ncbi:ABC transporter related protein [Conexibacter woesei DSM 14684]|uniref:ABC transporter related protein n=2 Tax=Conexibacter TaxID=191494 RepID=D3FBY7_CONWI|nr:ABC transporter related protein [Conexibacter woesei DSM 14684]